MEFEDPKFHLKKRNALEINEKKKKKKKHEMNNINPLKCMRKRAQDKSSEKKLILKTHTYESPISFNLKTPNVNYSGRTAPLTSKVEFYIIIQQI